MLNAITVIYTHTYTRTRKIWSYPHKPSLEEQCGPLICRFVSRNDCAIHRNQQEFNHWNNDKSFMQCWLFCAIECTEKKLNLCFSKQMRLLERPFLHLILQTVTSQIWGASIHIVLLLCNSCHLCAQCFGMKWDEIFYLALVLLEPHRQHFGCYASCNYSVCVCKFLNRTFA